MARAVEPDPAIPAATRDKDVQLTNARARDTDAAEFKPVVLSKVTSGDNVYLELTPVREGGTPETVLCTARECAGWLGQGLPRALGGRRVGAKFGRADRVDGSGTIMERSVRAVVGLRLPDASSVATRAAGGVVLPLTPGVYVLEGTDCRNPANAAFRIWNGRGLSGSATKDCRATVLSRSGETYTVRNSCVNTYDGSRTPETLTVRVPDPAHLTVKGNRFRSCSMAQVPASLRKLVR